MFALLVASFLASVVMAAAVVAMLRPPDPGEVVLRAVTATFLACGMTVLVGLLTDADTAEFLLALALGVAPVTVLLGAAAGEAAPGERRVARSLVYLWAGIVFPLCVVVPALVFRGCATPECRVEDFGGGLPLLVSSAASVLLAWRAHEAGPERGWLRFSLAVAVLWLGVAVWLASLEGAIDPYTGRILLAAVASPAGGAIAWLLVDVLRRAERHPVRSLADGVVAGLVAIVPGAATVSFPWSLLVGALAGAVAALVFGARRLASAGRAGHWALVVLSSTAVGYLAPAISGDTIGLVFSGRIAALLPPLVAFTAVGAIGVFTSAISWLVIAKRKKPPV
ncbi:ammonium transporter [Protaetiibacter intestinalis]|uniref:Ammonium transporter n=1 Tax=Protaetiibacter intestinalis TaxID=2419774 RepID=A0A387B9T6_9MICO|nr:ammonium transporter [Protaetiibacter intestinalis]AYF99147.1 ammonium transporter [Protaetiibacter intestinalis]